MMFAQAEINAADYMPVLGSAGVKGAKVYDVMLRYPGAEWVFGTTADTPSMAMACMNFVRREKPLIGVRLVPRPRNQGGLHEHGQDTTTAST